MKLVQTSAIVTGNSLQIEQPTEVAGMTVSSQALAERFAEANNRGFGRLETGPPANLVIVQHRLLI